MPPSKADSAKDEGFLNEHRQYECFGSAKRLQDSNLASALGNRGVHGQKNGKKAHDGCNEDDCIQKVSQRDQIVAGVETCETKSSIGRTV